MFIESLHTFLISISPLGEARVGIPMGIVKGLHPLMAIGIGLAANLMVFPVFNWLITQFDYRLWRYRFYRKHSVKMMRRAKSQVGTKIQKYGFWGLMVFVMIPLPVTGAYMGVIAARVLSIHPKEAFKAISLGVTISCTIIGVISYAGAHISNMA